MRYQRRVCVCCKCHGCLRSANAPGFPRIAVVSGFGGKGACLPPPSTYLNEMICSSLCDSPHVLIPPFFLSLSLSSSLYVHNNDTVNYRLYVAAVRWWCADIPHRSRRLFFLLIERNRKFSPLCLCQVRRLACFNQVFSSSNRQSAFIYINSLVWLLPPTSLPFFRPKREEKKKDEGRVAQLSACLSAFV